MSVSPVKEYVKELTDRPVKQRLSDEKRNKKSHRGVLNEASDVEQFICQTDDLLFAFDTAKAAIWISTGSGL